MFIPLVIATVCRIIPPSEPEFHGVALNEWLDRSYDFCTGEDEVPRYGEAATAVRGIGTNAIPIILQMMNERDSRLRSFIANHAPKRLHFNDADYDRMAGAYGFIALGAQSKPAVPALIKLADDPDPEMRYGAVVALGYLDCAPEQIVPALVKHLDDTRVLGEAAEGLGRLGQEPRIAIPALIRHIGHSPTGSDNSYYVAWALACFGSQAKPAIPALLKRLQEDQDEHDSNPSLQQIIKEAITAIDPESASQEFKDSESN